MAFITITFGIFEAGRIVLAQNAMQSAVETATRYILVNGDATEEEITDYLTFETSSMTLDFTKVTLDIAYNTDADVDFIEIDATYDFTPLTTSFLPASWTSITLAASSRMPIQNCSAENCPE